MSKSETESARFVRLRAERNWTQTQMGDALGVAKNYIYLIESGRKTPSRKLVEKLDQLESLPPAESNSDLTATNLKRERDVDQMYKPEGGPSAWADASTTQLELLLSKAVENKEWGAVEKIAAVLFNRKLKGWLR